MTEIHISADKHTWTGASTTAMLCALQAEHGVVISAGDDDITRRMTKSGAEVACCPMGGFLASVNLSRALRHIPGKEFEVYLHSPEKQHVVDSAMKLVGRTEPMKMQERKLPYFPPIKVAPPTDCTIMWLGNITDNCGLREIIEELGTKADKQWRLRVVGQGQAKIVSPILKRTKALGIADRIEWIGYSENPYEHMNGVKAAIVKSTESVAAHEFAAASIPVYTQLSDIL